MRKMRHVVGLMVVLMALVFSGLSASSIAFSEGSDPSTKICGLLYLQIEDKERYLEKPATASEIDISKAVGIRTENLAMQRIYIYFLSTPSASQVQELHDLGIIMYQDTWIPPVVNHPAGFLLADMPVDKLDELASKSYVMRLDTAERVHEPQNDLAVIKTNVDDVWDLGYDGSGITIAVLDSGLDTAHPDIPAPIGSWDYAEDDATIGNTVTGHGTHVTGSALGRGTQSAGQYRGVAPGADLVFLKIGRDLDAVAPDPVMVDALHDAVDLPIYDADIITLSYGGWSQYHDGSSATAQAVDYAHSQGAAVFCSAGNAADNDQHYSGTVSASGTTNFIRVNVIGAGASNTALAFNLVWFDDLGVHNDLDLEYYDSGYNLLTDITASPQSESPRGTESVYSHYDFYVPSGDSTYYLRVRNNAPVDQFFHIYYDSSYNLAGAGRVTFQVPDPFYTLSAPATADNAIAVGSYTTRESWTNYRGNVYSYGETIDTITTFSSRGPRVDEGVPKPNIIAPGSAIISVRDMDVYTLPGPDPGYDQRVIDNDGLNIDGSGPADYFVMQGTSMASPHAAGVAALLLEAHPGLVGNPATLRCVLEVAAGNKGAHDNTSGYGLVDANASINPIALGLCWLNETQNPDGSWQNSVGITSMAALAFLNAGHTEDNPTVNKAIQYILTNRNADGSFGGGTYETSTAIWALVATHNASYNDEIADAKDWLVDAQYDEGEGANPTNVYYGGWRYGSSPSNGDLSNTQFALMALSAAGLPSGSDTWTKAITFTSRCQNRPASNDQAWAHDDTQPSYNDGGFIYYPTGGSLAGGSKSYGSMTAAGIWSLRLSGVDVSDGRVQAGLNWLANNEDCSFDDNPIMPDGRRFQYYYYMSIAKALVMCFEDDLICADWYAALSTKLADLQYDDGHWVNSYTGHGQENIPEVATDYALLALQTRQPPAANLWMSIILASNATLTVYDPQGRHARLGDVTIPGATFEIDAEGRQIVNLTELEAGKYRIELKGTADGDYSLTIEGYREEEQTSTETFEGTIEEGEYQKSDVLVTSMVGALTIYVEEPKPLLVTDLPNVELVSADPTVTSINVTDLNLSEVNETYKPEECITPQSAYMVNSTGAGNFTLRFTDIPNADTIIVYKINATNQWIELDATTTADTVTFTMSVGDPPVVFCSGAPPVAARVPILTPIGIIALAGLLAIVAVSRMRRKR